MVTSQSVNASGYGWTSKREWMNPGGRSRGTVDAIVEKSSGVSYILGDAYKVRKEHGF